MRFDCTRRTRSSSSLLAGEAIGNGLPKPRLGKWRLRCMSSPRSATVSLPVLIPISDSCMGILSRPVEFLFELPEDARRSERRRDRLVSSLGSRSRPHRVR